jgi:hypothetical protein
MLDQGYASNQYSIPASQNDLYAAGTIVKQAVMKYKRTPL